MRNTKKFQALAADLRERCAEKGVTLMGAEAEDVLAAQIDALSKQLGIKPRAFLDTYLQPGLIDNLAAALAEANAVHVEVADTAESINLSSAEAGRVVAALGMVMKIATNRVEDPQSRADALGISTDGADAIVGVGVALRGAGPGQNVTVSGSAAMYTRKVLGRMIDLLTNGTWTCACGTTHDREHACRTVNALVADLQVVGGWVNDANEPPANRR